MTEQFLLDINPNAEPIEYNLVLTKLNGEPLQELHNIEDLEFKFYFANIDEISFKVPFYITENDGTQAKNELYDLVDGSMMVLLNDMKYFILTKPQIEASEQTGEKYKTILGFSREYELAKKRLVDYNAPSRLLYDYSNGFDENGVERGFLNFIENHTSWKISYVNSNLLTKYRYLNFPKSTYLQAFQEVQRAFGALFKFDTINKTISVYEATQLGVNQGLFLSDKNFLNKLSQEINHDEIVTRLFLLGRDNVSIQSINISGQSYIESFDFYKSTKYMSQGLIDALNSYENYIATKEGVFSGYLTQLNTHNDNMNTKRIELATLITELRVIESDLDIAIASNQSTTTLKSQQTAKISEINNKQIEIDGVVSQINAVQTNINNLSVDISLNSHLTEEQARELDPFIREDEYSDVNYTEENIQELLDEGKKILARVSYPNLQFNLQVEDFLSLIEGQHMRDKFILGDLMNLEHEELGFDYEVRLIGYTHSPDDNKLSLTFSNRNSVDDANIYLRDLLESVTTTASTVDYNKFKWDKGEEANSIINEYVNNALNLAKQQILKADGQKPMIDDRGIWLIKENPDGSVDPKQVRLINNVLAITNDNWNTISTAITGDGIAAEVIRGKLGQFATVQADQVKTGILKSTDGSTQINLDDGSFNFKNALKWENNQLVISGLESGGNKIFNSQPTPPYKLNDLWKVSGVAGVDFKICTTARASGSYVASDWTNVSDSKTYADAIKNLTTGTAISGGTTTIDNTKVRVSHGTGQYSEMNANGFIRKWLYGEAEYLNGIYVTTVNEGLRWYDSELSGRPPTRNISLPISFRDRTNLKVFAFPIGWGAEIGDLSSTMQPIELSTRFEVEVRVRDIVTNVSIPYVGIQVYIHAPYYHSDYYYSHRYWDVEYVLMVVGG